MFFSRLKILCCFLLPLSAGLLSASENFNFSLDLDFGLLNGHIYEYVFHDINQNTDHMESMLDWDVKNIPYFELSAQTDLWKYVYVGFDGKIGVPKSSGNMQDYDWLNSVGGGGDIYPAWKSKSPFELTNYSKHNNNLTSYYCVNFSVGGNIPLLGNSVKITPFLSYDYWFIGFDGSKGYGEYKSNNFVREYFNGSVISYKQEYNSFLLGTTVSGTVFNNFYLEGTLMISPMMVYNVSIDNHKVRNVIFIDIINNAFEIKGQLQAKYKFNNLLNFGIKSSIQYIPVSKGYDYMNPPQKDGKYYITNPEPGVQGGTSSFLWTFSLNCGLTL